MQGLWYGDRRDRVKWGAVFYIAAREELPTIACIAFYRETATAGLEISSGEHVQIPAPVLNHFSDLRGIKNLEGHGVERINIFSELWSAERAAYVDQAINWLDQLNGNEFVFLDPDTGIAPPSRDGLGHLREQEINRFWGALRRSDWLAVYQHAAHNQNWERERRRVFTEACRGAEVATIRGTGLSARDVAVFAAKKQ